MYIKNDNIDMNEKRYGEKNEFVSVELELVIAMKVRDLGLDRFLITA